MSTFSIPDLQQTIQLLKVEKESDQKQYQEKLSSSTIAERRQSGITWYPIIIKDSYYGLGERLIVEFERPTHQEIENQFQVGSPVQMFSNLLNEGAENPKISGVVSASRANFLKITFSADELPEWTSTGKLGIDLLFEESTYKEMEISMNKVIKANHSRLSIIRDVFFGDKIAEIADSIPIKLKKLNDSQNIALNHVLNSKDVAIIHGPPGTGKTTTLIECIHQTLKHEKQILVCAPSNAAVDLLSELLGDRGISVLRLGNISRVNDKMLSKTLDYQVSMHPDFKMIKEYKKRAAEFRKMGSKYKRNFGREERAQRKAIFDEARKLQGEAEKIENYITSAIISTTQVITATLVGSSFYLIRDMQFSSVFIDEAGQALEPACWIPITRADRVIMAGDHLQLPPTIKSIEAANNGLNITLMEKGMRIKNLSSMLAVQYRMHEAIMEFSNQKFYNGLLVAHESNRNSRILTLESHEYNPVEFIDTAGCGFTEMQEKEGTSLANVEEGELLVKSLNMFLELLAEKVTIGIISPYRSQVKILQERNLEISKHPFVRSISINSVDAFQGQERDVICISLVRSNPAGEIGFLRDTRRMNVAITRAKKKLIIIGDSATIGNDKFYNDFIRYTESIDSYRSAWEFN